MTSVNAMESNVPKWAIGAGLLLALAIWKGKDVYSTIRGLRNNNPGNIENNGIPWDGLSSRQTDSRFYQFESPEWGIRALGKILLNYQRHHGIDTVRGIVNRWAPPIENDTAAYVAAVARRVGVEPDEPINVARVLPALTAAIIKHENGIQPYSDGFIVSSLGLIDGLEIGRGTYA